MLIKFFKWIW